MTKYVPYKDDYKKAADAFYDLCNMFFDKNFGFATKSEIEIFLFHHLLESLRNDNEKISDYHLSKQIGITQQRIRNLRIKENLMYPSAIDILTEFEKLIQKASYDTNTKKIIIDIEDPNLYIELQHVLQEEHNAYIDKQLNSRLLIIKPNYLFSLLATLSENEKEIISQLKKQTSIFDKSITKLEGKKFWKYFTQKVTDVKLLIDAGKAVWHLIPVIESLINLIESKIVAGI